MTQSLAFDHLAISGETLAEAATWTEDLLGVPLEAGGQHPHMGTHNRLLSLGTDEYLEVIAIDPDGTPPGRPRWFDLDRFAGAPRLTNWICRTDDIQSALDHAPTGTGTPVALTRSIYAWQMAIPNNGILPFDACHPALIEWAGTAHPAQALPDRGCRLTKLEIRHPEADNLRNALTGLVDPRVALIEDPNSSCAAEIETPKGRIWLR